MTVDGDVFVLAALLLVAMTVTSVVAIQTKRLRWPLKRRAPKQNEMFAAGLRKDFAATYDKTYRELCRQAGSRYAEKWHNGIVVLHPANEKELLERAYAKALAKPYVDTRLDKHAIHELSESIESYMAALSEWSHAAFMADLKSKMPLDDVIEKWREHIPERKPKPAPYDPDAQDYIDACAVRPDAKKQKAIHQLFVDLRGKGNCGTQDVLSKLDCMGLGDVKGGTDWSRKSGTTVYFETSPYPKKWDVPPLPDAADGAAVFSDTKWCACCQGTILKHHTYCAGCVGRNRATCLHGRKPAFSRGQWVRHKSSGTLGQVTATGIKLGLPSSQVLVVDIDFPSDTLAGSIVPESYLDIALPRKGEWWEMKTLCAKHAKLNREWHYRPFEAAVSGAQDMDCSCVCVPVNFGKGHVSSKGK